MASRYSDALREQHTLAARLRNPADKLQRGFTSIFNMARSEAALHGDLLGAMADEADTYFWAQPVTDAVWQASQGFPTDWRFDLGLLPSKVAFVWFEEAVATEMDDGSRAYLRGFMWETIDADDLAASRVERTLIDSVARKEIARALYQPHMLLVCLIALEPHGEYFPLTTMIIPHDHPICELQGLSGTRSLYEPEEGYTNAAMRELRFLCTMLVFLNQQLIEASTQRADRATRRDIERKAEKRALAPTGSRSPVQDSVRVVLLRRPQRAHSDANGTGDNPHKHVDWSCQWLVHGHWRYQPYPSQHTHKLRFIAPYWKGPQDKPVRVSERVLAVVR